MSWANGAAGAHLPYKQGVVGSNPTSPTTGKGFSEELSESPFMDSIYITYHIQACERGKK